MKKRFVVIGLGNFGLSVARNLFEGGHEVVAFDLRAKIVDSAAKFVSRAVVGDGSDVNILREAGADRADCGVISTGDDLTASILSVLALQDIGINEIHVKVISQRHERVIHRMGIEETVFPEQDSGQNLAHRIMSGGLLHYIAFGRSFSIQEMIVPEKWLGRNLRELRPRSMGIQIVAVHDVLLDKIILPPDPDAELKVSDTLIIAGRDDALSKLTGENEAPAPAKKRKKRRK